MNKNISLQCIGMISMLASACSQAPCPEAHTEKADPLRVGRANASELEDELVGLRLGKAQSSGSSGFQSVYVDQQFIQRIRYGSKYDYEDPSKMVIQNISRDSSGSWGVPESYEFSSSFAIAGVSANKKDQFYLLGIAPNGDTVIEHWKRKKIGSPNSGPGYNVKRKELFRGTTLGPVLEIGADPAGRYLLMVHGQPAKLSQMTLPTGIPIVSVYDSGQLPGLYNLNLVTGMLPREHSTDGRVWILETFGNVDPSTPGSPRTLVYDTDNDGSFDSWLSPVYNVDWEALGYDQDVWLGHPHLFF